VPFGDRTWFFDCRTRPERAYHSMPFSQTWRHGCVRLKDSRFTFAGGAKSRAMRGLMEGPLPIMRLSLLYMKRDPLAGLLILNTADMLLISKKTADVMLLLYS
jgi:hypothetical protein